MELSRATGAQRANMKKTLVGQESVRRAAGRGFRRHGALSVQMSHLLPKGKQQGGDSIAWRDLKTNFGRFSGKFSEDFLRRAVKLCRDRDIFLCY